MSLKRNVLANYVGQIYTTLIAIVMVPLYVRYMGTEAYGLIGFFSTLQVIFQLLDIGLTPTMSRETARFNGGATDAFSLRRLLRALEGIFVAVAVLGAGALIAGADLISSRWLRVQELSLYEVKRALVLMAIIVALRWMSGLYRGAITGFERLVWLSGFNIIVTTARFVLVIPFFVYFGATPTHFFSYQLAVAVLELVVLMAQANRCLPGIPSGQKNPWRWEPLRGVLKFSLSIAFTSTVWILVTQTDKLILSKLLPLKEYAVFSLAVLVASGVLLISGPISGALMPRLTKLHAEGDAAGLIRLYRNSTQLVAVIAVPAALVLAFFSEQVLWAWTGNPTIARHAAPVSALYALGNAILAIRAFPYYLQFAKGDLKLHLVGSVLNIVVLVPILTWATLQFGVLGAAYTWLGTNIAFLIFWTPFVHRHLVQGLHRKWLLHDLAPIVGAASGGAALLHTCVAWPDGRLSLTLYVAAVSVVVLVLSAGSSDWVRGLLCRHWNAQFSR